MTFWYSLKKIFKSNRVSRQQIDNDRQILFDAFCCLIGNTPKNLRLASIDRDKPSACMYFYLDGKIEDHVEKALYSALETFRSTCNEKSLKSCTLKIIQTDESQLIIYKGQSFFARKERYGTPEEINRRIDVILAFHLVLLGEIPSNLRAASISWNKYSACHFFYFDGPISEETLENLDIIGTEFISCFHYEDMNCFDNQFIRCDEPEMINVQGELVYLRKEKWQLCD